MSTEFFHVVVVIGIFASATLVLWSLRDIAKLLAAILDEMTGKSQKMRDQMDFYYRGDKEKEKP